MDEAKLQTAFLQSSSQGHTESLPMLSSNQVRIPQLPSEHHVLVRVLAVALNPIDYKNILHFHCSGRGVGSDFCGIVADQGKQVNSINGLTIGTRVCGAVFPYSHHEDTTSEQRSISSGAFAEWVVADARLLLRVPQQWDDIHGAALGGVGWLTVGLAMSDPDALDLTGTPSQPTNTREPVLVYGGGTATGTMACQLLKVSGYAPITTVSSESAGLASGYGAVATTGYASVTCAEDLKRLAKVPIRHAIDCITSPESVATCFAALARTGGRYTCLEALNETWRTRHLIRVKEVMGYESLGQKAQLGSAPSTYSRDANKALFGLGQIWRKEIQDLPDAGVLKHHPVRELLGEWTKTIPIGLDLIRKGEIKGQKFVVRLVTKLDS